jgi:succinylglutamate desuccinylase
MWSRLQDEFEVDMDQQEGNFNAIHPGVIALFPNQCQDHVS